MSTSSPINDGTQPDVTTNKSSFAISIVDSIKFLSFSSPPKITCSSTKHEQGVLVPPSFPPADSPPAYNVPNNWPTPHPAPECNIGIPPLMPNVVP